MAKKLTKEEAEALGMRPFGRKHFVRAMIEQMKPGEILQISRKDFAWHNQNPNRFINPLMKSTKKKFTITQTADRSGWIVARTE